MWSSVDLPAPEGATQRHGLPGMKREARADQNVEARLALAIMPAEVDELERGTGHAVHSPRSASTGSSDAAFQAG